MTTSERLRLVRLAGDYSLAEIAAQADVSPEDLSAFESGAKSPTPEQIWHLAGALRVDLGFFLRTLPVLGVYPISERLDKLSAAERERVIAQTRLWIEQHVDIESFFDFSDLPIPEYPPGFPMAAKSPKDASEAADRLRRMWRLGTGPVLSLATTLEAGGVKVGFIDGAGDFDSCAMLTDEEMAVPFIVVRRDLPGDIQRFAVARELAYFMLESAASGMSLHFAATFLAPAAAMVFEVGEKRTNLELLELLRLKQKYGVSMRRLLTRLASLAIIPKAVHDEWHERFRANGWQAREPGGDLPAEQAERMVQMVLRLQAEDEISPDRGAELLGIPQDEWNEMLLLGQEAEEETEDEEETVVPAVTEQQDAQSRKAEAASPNNADQPTVEEARPARIGGKRSEAPVPVSDKEVDGAD